jgi:hypothetical protein
MTSAAFRLVCHPASDPGPVTRLEARAHRDDAGGLRIEWLLTGDLARLRIPSPGSPRRADRLWEHTCFEAFIPVAAGTSAYSEFNFAPSGEWAVWGFRGYRDGMTPLEPAPPPVVRTTTAIGQLAVSAALPPGLLPPPTAVLRLALAAVIEDVAGERSYWALHHPREMPDFHAAEAVVALLAPVAPPVITS